MLMKVNSHSLRTHGSADYTEIVTNYNLISYIIT